MSSPSFADVNIVHIWDQQVFLSILTHCRNKLEFYLYQLDAIKPAPIKFCKDGGALVLIKPAAASNSAVCYPDWHG